MYNIFLENTKDKNNDKHRQYFYFVVYFQIVYTGYKYALLTCFESDQ